MAATSLLAQLKSDFPDLKFTDDQLFFWAASDQTIHIGPDQPHHNLLILHELGHAALEHFNYTQDIELLQMEVAAWTQAKTLADRYGIPYEQDFIEHHLDTYRDWLARRSECPDCHMTGYQTPDTAYHCPSCLARWHTKVNRIKF